VAAASWQGETGSIVLVPIACFDLFLACFVELFSCCSALLAFSPFLHLAIFLTSDVMFLRFSPKK